MSSFKFEGCGGSCGSKQKEVSHCCEGRDILSFDFYATVPKMAGAVSVMVENDTEMYISRMWLQAVEVSRRRMRHQRHQKMPRLRAVKLAQTQMAMAGRVALRRKPTLAAKESRKVDIRESSEYVVRLLRNFGLHTRFGSDRRRPRYTHLSAQVRK